MDKGSFEFPSNVKQIGSIDESMKVYVEDYAYRYICQYARSETHSEKIGVLVGEYIEIEGQNIVLISGFIQGKYSDNVNGILTFTDETWEYVKTRQDRYYKDFEIIGWLRTQPGNGTTISDDDRKFHEEHFFEPYQVLFIMDSIEKVDAFFVWDNEQLRELNGYFIYYAKNECMQEYIIDNKLVKSRSYDYREDNPPEKEDAIVNYRRLDRNRREEIHQKKVLNMLVGTSGIVVVLCFLMGLLLIQNSQRMSKLETELTDVYKQISGKSRISDNETALVFASQDETIAQNQSEDYGEENIIPTKEEESTISKENVTEATTKEVQESSQESTENTTEPTTQKQEETTAQTEAATQTTTQKQEQPTTQSQQAKQNDLPEFHLVKEGDSLSWISKHYYGTNKMINRIMEYNDIKDPDRVYIGMEIKLPKE